MSRYMMLELIEEREHGKNLWRQTAVREAASAAAAVRDYVQVSGSEGGVFIAIPERSAKTIRVKVETVQKVSVDAGDGDA